LIYSSYGGDKIIFYISQIILVFILGNAFNVLGTGLSYIFGKFGHLLRDFVFKSGPTV